MKIAIGSDHGGYELKEAIKVHLMERGIKFIDVGTNSSASVDYPEYAHRLDGTKIAYTRRNPIDLLRRKKR